MEDLETYYECDFRIPGLPPFKKLKDEDKKMVENTFGFGVYKLHREIERFFIELKRKLRL